MTQLAAGDSISTILLAIDMIYRIGYGWKQTGDDYQLNGIISAFVLPPSVTT